MFGYDWVVIGGAKPFYERFFQLQNPRLQGWVVSCALIGCLVGALISGGLVLIYVVLGWLYSIHSQGVHMLVLVVTAIACYAMSLAPVTWVIISEIFPSRIRGIAMSACVTVLWLACFLLTFTFPSLNRSLGASGTFWIYSAICALGFVYLLKALPETRGKSLEEIEVSWS